MCILKDLEKNNLYKHFYYRKMYVIFIKNNLRKTLFCCFMMLVKNKVTEF